MNRTMWVILLSLTIISLGVWVLAMAATANEPVAPLHSAPALYNLDNSALRAR